ncbi:hypothetical protein FSP39_001003 [Pinctada imbricata]|uniref:Uncharacterized protein n=1 Tax=Pinctada imbricata TaxID=66713 RepID=A0AA88XT54_PINIB|nr:hypothetical protein FSP39_001003 [Pinctada imbricata]
MGFGDISLLVKISFIAIIVGFIVNLIGFASPYWTSYSIVAGRYHAGLWQACVNGCSDHNNVAVFITLYLNKTSYFVPLDWLAAARAFGVIGFLASVAALVLVVLYIFLSKASNKLVYIATFCSCFVTAGCVLLSVLIFAAFTTNLDWAWAFCVVALITFNVCGVLLVADAKG